MPWHLSKSDPRKVYDERHQTVCVCQTAEQARYILDAVLAFGGNRPESLGLREPASDFPSTNEAKKPEAESLTQTYQEDDCCGKHISKAIRNGTINRDIWTCPDCGEEWRPRRAGMFTHWTPQPLIAVLR